MANLRRVNLRSILADPNLRRELMVPTIQATQAREGIETTREQAERAYYVVTEGERTAFFDLKRLRGSRRQEDSRLAAFVQALGDNLSDVRLDVARRDFSSLSGRPLSYRKVHVLAPVVAEHQRLEHYAAIHQGVITRDDPRFLRYSWEVGPNAKNKPWIPLHKGGSFCRFYYATDLVIDWSEEAQSLMHRLRDKELYFKSGLTWPRRTQRGFNVRIMPGGCIFADKGPAIFSTGKVNRSYLLGILNSRFTEYILQGLTSFGSWEIGAVKGLPIPQPSRLQQKQIGVLAKEIFRAKAKWDRGNEISKRFSTPWLLRVDMGEVTLSARLDHLAEVEHREEDHINELYEILNNEVYNLFGIPNTIRALVENTLGERPPEILWPQMENQSLEQKRMEHVFRLLSYAVKRVVEDDEDGVVPFVSMAGEPGLLERVLNELHSYFPDRDIGQVETEIVNELNKSVKGYRRTRSLAEWLENVFFTYHSTLYKNRPIVWHITSGQETPFAFGALVHYHKFNRDRMAKLRSQYLREALETFRREAALADKEGRPDDRVEWLARLEEAQELDRHLQRVQEGEGDFGIQTPWKIPAERPVGWDPDLDDGVKVNIEPLQKAGVLRK